MQSVCPSSFLPRSQGFRPLREVPPARRCLGGRHEGREGVRREVPQRERLGEAAPLHEWSEPPGRKRVVLPLFQRPTEPAEHPEDRQERRVNKRCRKNPRVSSVVVVVISAALACSQGLRCLLELHAEESVQGPKPVEEFGRGDGLPAGLHAPHVLEPDHPDDQRGVQLGGTVPDLPPFVRKATDGEFEAVSVKPRRVRGELRVVEDLAQHVQGVDPGEVRKHVQHNPGVTGGGKCGDEGPAARPATITIIPRSCPRPR